MFSSPIMLPTFMGEGRAPAQGGPKRRLRFGALPVTPPAFNMPCQAYPKPTFPHPHVVPLQTHGAAGVSDVTPLAHMWAGARTLRLADGPDVVHLETIAKLELAAARRSKL